MEVRCVLAAWIAFLVLTSTSAGQEFSESSLKGSREKAFNAISWQFLSPNNSTLSFSCDQADGVSFAFIDQTRFSRSRDFFSSDALHDEIELVVSQKSKFTAALKQWKRELVKPIQEYEAATDSGDVEKAQYRYLLIRKAELEAERAFSKSILSHQYHWMKQIQTRYIIRTHGLLKVLELEDVVTFAELTEGELQQLENSKSDCQKYLLAKSTQLLEEAFEVLFDNDSNDRLNLIRKKYPASIRGAVFDLEKLRIQLMMLEAFENRREYRSPFEELAQSPSYELSVSGGFEAMQYPVRFEERHENGMKISLIRSVLSGKSLDRNDYFQISPETRDQCLGLIQEMRQGMIKLWHEQNDSNATTRSEIEILAAQHQEKEVALEANTWSALKRLIGGNLESIVEDIAVDTLILQYGPLVNLIHGELGETLALTESDKQALRAKIRETSKLIDEGAIEIERETLTQQIELLDDVSQRKVKELLGPTLKKSAPSLYGILAGLR